MKNLIPLIVFIATLPAAAQAPLTYKTVHEHHKTAHVSIDVHYPKVSQAALDARIAALLPKPPADLSDLAADEGYNIDETFKVTYNDHGLFCVYGEGLNVPVKGGKINAAHPSKLFDGIILDTKTNRALSIEDMFNHRGRVQLRDMLIADAARQMQLQTHEVVLNDDFRAYLTTSGLTFYNLFEASVASSVHVSLTWKELGPILNPNSSIRRARGV